MTKLKETIEKPEGLGRTFIINEIMETRLLPELWRVILSAQFKDDQHISEIITKYNLNFSVNQTSAFFRPHQKKLRNIWIALVEGRKPPEEDWYYVQNYISKHINLRYDYELATSKDDSKTRAIVIRRHEPKGTVATMYYTFMEAILTEINGHNLGALMRSFNECTVCRNFFDPDCFHNSENYCSDYCRLQKKKTAQNVRYHELKEK